MVGSWSSTLQDDATQAHHHHHQQQQQHHQHQQDADDDNEDDENVVQSLQVVRGLGQGGFAVVVGVEHVETKQMFAMKCIDKVR
jgi:hypothetical protein